MLAGETDNKQTDNQNDGDLAEMSLAPVVREDLSVTLRPEWQGSGLPS